MSIVMPGDRLEARSIRFDGTGDHWADTASGLVLPTYAAPAPEPPRLVGISTFTGAGGFDLGMHQAGFHMAVATDHERVCAATYLTNLGRPDTVIVPLDDYRATKSWPGFTAGEPVLAGDVWDDIGTGWIAHHICTIDECLIRGGDHREPNEYLQDINQLPEHDSVCDAYFLGDVRKLTGKLIAEAVPYIDEWDILVGGPPCQGFSAAGRRQVLDERNSLIFEFARLIVETRPRTFVMENVPGVATMVTPEGQPVLDAMAWIVSEGGWSDYEAVKRAMAHSSAGAAAIRGGMPLPRNERRTTPQEPQDLDGQLDLFTDAQEATTP